METLRATPLVSSDSNWFIQQGGNATVWTKEENKKFESALAIFDEKTPNRWFRVAAMIPGKSVYDVMNQYRVLEADVCDIEAGLFPIPAYLASSFTYDLSDVCRKRGRTSCDQERKKGVPWTEEEHRRFLLGLQKHGKGDWRNISRNFVISKTPTQVASHAQKYYLRQLSGAKDKRRPSIHDITTVHVTTTSPLNNTNKNNNEKPPFPEKPIDQMPTSTPKIPVDQSGHINDKIFMDFDSVYNDLFISYPCNVAPQNWHNAKTGATTTPYIQI